MIKSTTSKTDPFGRHCVALLAVVGAIAWLPLLNLIYLTRDEPLVAYMASEGLLTYLQTSYNDNGIWRIVGNYLCGLPALLPIQVVQLIKIGSIIGSGILFYKLLRLLKLPYQIAYVCALLLIVLPGNFTVVPFSDRFHYTANLFCNMIALYLISVYARNISSTSTIHKVLLGILIFFLSLLSLLIIETSLVLHIFAPLLVPALLFRGLPGNLNFRNILKLLLQNYYLALPGIASVFYYLLYKLTLPADSWRSLPKSFDYSALVTYTLYFLDVQRVLYTPLLSEHAPTLLSEGLLHLTSLIFLLLIPSLVLLPRSKKVASSDKSAHTPRTIFILGIISCGFAILMNSAFYVIVGIMSGGRLFFAAHPYFILGAVLLLYVIFTKWVVNLSLISLTLVAMILFVPVIWINIGYAIYEARVTNSFIDHAIENDIEGELHIDWPSLLSNDTFPSRSWRIGGFRSQWALQFLMHYKLDNPVGLENEYIFENISNPSNDQQLPIYTFKENGWTRLPPTE
jgi:hypothetical protein